MKNKKIRLLNEHDLHEVNQFIANQAAEDSTSASASSMLVYICLLLAGIAVFCIPSNFLDYENFNGKCALIFLAAGGFFAIISRITGLHVNNNHFNRTGHE